MVTAMHFLVFKVIFRLVKLYYLSPMLIPFILYVNMKKQKLFQNFAMQKHRLMV